MGIVFVSTQLGYVFWLVHLFIYLLAGAFNPYRFKLVIDMCNPIRASLVAETAYNAGDSGLIPWRREWQTTPLFLPGEFCGEKLQTVESQTARQD